MVLSMTGFGSAVHENDGIIFKVEIKSINAKSLDLRIKVPSKYLEKEIEIQNLIEKNLDRGKVDFYLTLNGQSNTDGKRTINRELFNSYFHEIESIATENNLDQSNILPVILNYPEIYSSNNQAEEISSSEWAAILQTVQQAIDNLIEHRKNEGNSLAIEMLKSIEIIDQDLKKIDSIRDKRSGRISEKLRQRMLEAGIAELDPYRLEQEILYYSEKLDITEEIDRLLNHLAYFKETLEKDGGGKKLGFITQEMGREINTIGSKANDFDIQKKVVLMKNELEKVKQQLANIL